MQFTPEQIVERAEKHFDDIDEQFAYVETIFWAQDESYKWPINGKLKVTNMAIKEARRTFCNDTLEYALFIDAEISRIVNDAKNW